MLLIYTGVSIAGASVTALLLGDLGPIVAASAMPFGGSLAVLLCAVPIARFRHAVTSAPPLLWGHPRP